MPPSRLEDIHVIRVTHVKREVLVDQKDDFSVTEVEGGSQLTGQTQAAEEIFTLIDIDFP